MQITDHLNYKADTLGTDATRFDEALEAGWLEQVSEVILENVTVTPIEQTD